MDKEEEVPPDQTNAGQDQDDMEEDLEAEVKKKGLVYFSINDVPPWYMCIIFGFQHYLTMFGSTYIIPVIISNWLCVGNDNLARSEIVSTEFFVAGIATLMQTILGSRLPIVQGGSAAYLAPTIAIMSLPKWKCPDIPDANISVNATINQEIWQVRMREIQGAIIVSSIFQIIIGFTGLLGLLLKFIGPLVISPVIALVGLSLFELASRNASKHWGISMAVVALVTIFSQYLRNVKVPCAGFSRKHGWRKTSYPIFQLFPVVLSVGLVWLLCYVLTITNVFPDDPKVMGYFARTDVRVQVLRDAQWFRVPYPGQWGVPTVSASAVFGMLAGVLAGIVESVGDYYACARVSGAPPPPMHAMNRGIGMEGLGCLIAGLLGSGNGTTSYSQNIGAIGLTKVGSRVVVQVAAVMIIIFSTVGKIGAFFVCMPDPITGGLFLVTFGIIVGIGLSNLSYVDLNSSRNVFILGFSIFAGMSIPRWISANPGIIKTGVLELDQILTVLLTTSMFVGGFVAAFLDNTVPGSREERGMIGWQRTFTTAAGTVDHQAYKCYEIAPCFACIRKINWFAYLPFCPTFEVRCRCRPCFKRDYIEAAERGKDVPIVESSSEQMNSLEFKNA